MSGALRVVTLNLWSRLGPWAERRAEAAAWLRALDPDIVLLQEVIELDDGTTTAEEVAAATGSSWEGAFAGIDVPDVLRVGTDEHRWGVAILSRRPIDQVDIVPLPPAGNHAAPPLLHVRTGGVDASSMHLAAPPRAGIARQRQVLVVEHAVRSLADPDAAVPPVFGGDFNADPDSDEVRFLCGLTALQGRTTYYQEAWRAAGPDEPGYTLTPANPHLAELNVARRRVDFVFAGDAFLRPEGAGRVLSARLAFDHPMTGTYASDHFGLVVDIIHPQRPD
jgi:endonuclease/exonuclease/phosphatase family metal-dependent hydrolase